MFDQQILGHLERQPLRLEAECLQHIRHLPHQTALDQLSNREVDPHRLRRIVAVLAAPHLALTARLLEHPAADFRDETRLFGDVNEIAWRHQTALWMFPTQQCFDSDDSPTVQRDNGLVVHTELIPLERSAKVGLEAKPSHGFLVHARIEDLETSASLLFRTIEG